ncbi:hypothetical protein BGZ98_006055 [Dissophora globulifera]|nr:hypothetical protein BGZ98_006055 [Dissophora globulifera]
MKFLAPLACLGAIASVATAYMNPTDPWSESIWKPNTQATITWDDAAVGGAMTPDMTFDIFLSTGSDQAQVRLAQIATGVKAATVSSVTYQVPVVSPPGKIYFLTFVQTAGTPLSGGLAWSTRFTITDTTGNTGTLAPTGASGANPGGNGTIVTGVVTVPATTPTGGASTPSGSSAAPTGTGAAAKPNGASSVSITAMSAAAAAVVGAVSAMIL